MPEHTEQAPKGMKISRTVDPRPPQVDMAGAADRHAQEDVASAMRQGQADQQRQNMASGPDDSMVIMLPDSRTVELAAPPMATAFLSARIMGEAGAKDVGAMFSIQAYIRALLYIRAINGQRVPRPTNFIEAQDLANNLGDVGMEHVALAVQQEWPQPDNSQLNVLRKPSRIPSS